MQKVVGSVDQGTTSTRFILWNENGEMLASHQMEHKQIYPQPGWTEHDPMEILRNTKECISIACEKCHVSPADVKGIGITNQRETTVLWDKYTGEPLYNAVVWLDTRTKDIVEKLIDGHGIDRFRKLTGLPVSTYFSATKIIWLLRNIDAVQKAVAESRCLFGTVDTWLTWHLTGGVNGGVHVTDVTNASRTMLMNLHTLQWDHLTCDALGVPHSILPEIKSSAEVYGSVSDGPLKGVPIAGILGDQHAATVGQGCFSAGQVKNTYGTGCFLVMNTGEKLVQSTHGLISTIVAKLGPDAPPLYGLEGSVAIAGAAVQWLRDNLGIISAAPEVGELASSVADTGGVYFVPAFSGLFAPRWRPDARGTIVGMTQYTRKEHICRAVLEAVCLQSRDVMDAMEKDAGVKISEVRVDGGMTVSDITMQIQADVVGCRVLRPRLVETTAFGVAFAAGLAVGLWKSPSDLKQTVASEFASKISSEAREEKYTRWCQAVDRSLDWDK